MPAPFPYDTLLAADPSNPARVATNADILLFAPGDPTKTPVVIWNLSRTIQLPNPVRTNSLGFAQAPLSDTLRQIAWEGGGLTGIFTSVQGIMDAADSAASSASASAGSAEESKTAAVAAANLVDAPSDVAMATIAATPGSQFSQELASTIEEATGTLVPPLVAAAIADDQTVVDAAVAAVSNSTFQNAAFQATVQGATNAKVVVNSVKSPQPQSTTGSWGSLAGGATISFQLPSGAAPDGGNAVSLTFTTVPTTAANTGVWVGRNTDLDIPTTPGDTLPFSILVKTSLQHTLVPGLRFYDAAGANVGNLVYGASVICPANTWTRLEYIYTVPAGATHARIYAVVPTGGQNWAAGETLLASQASTAPAPFFHGGTLGAIWDGTPWQSSSRTLRASPQSVFIGPITPGVAKGAEYVWFKTDGAGTLLDMLTGIGA